MMKIGLKKKIKSNSGASLSFGLILFAVCAILGVVILTAGTIVSGRLADKAEMDERYYMVISSAELLKEEFDNKETHIVRTKTKNGDTYTYDLQYEERGTMYSYFTNPYNTDFLTSQALLLLENKEQNETMFKADYYNSSSEESYVLNVPDGKEVSVISKATNGVIELKISYNEYTLKMTLAPDVNQIDSAKDNVETKDDTITWHVSNIEKVSK